MVLEILAYDRNKCPGRSTASKICYQLILKLYRRNLPQEALKSRFVRNNIVPRLCNSVAVRQSHGRCMSPVYRTCINFLLPTSVRTPEVCFFHATNAPRIVLFLRRNSQNSVRLTYASARMRWALFGVTDRRMSTVSRILAIDIWSGIAILADVKA